MHCSRTLPYTPSELAYVRGALGSVIASGTAQCSFSGFPTSQVWVGGKTGTTERPPHRDTSLVRGDGRGEPERAEVRRDRDGGAGGFGAEAAAPIARHVIEDIYHLPNNHQGGCAMGSR